MMRHDKPSPATLAGAGIGAPCIGHGDYL
jgi:hypothetical protein